MCHCDLLISDYSGAIIDYLIMQKPIILYTPDFKSFKKDPGLFFDYNKFNFCHKTTKYDQLVKLIKNIFQTIKNLVKNIRIKEKIKKLFFEKDLYFDENL